MELRHLRYFVAVAEELHFGRAADRLHIVQPALSKQIIALERELGLELLERAGGVRLTPAGEVLYAEARAILERLDRVVASTKATARGEAGSLSIGFVGPAMWNVLPAILREHRRTHPELRFHLHELGSRVQLERLREGSLDVGFLRRLALDDVLAFEPVWREQFVVCLPDDHPLAAAEVIDLSALKDEAFVVLPREDAPAIHDVTVTICLGYGFSPKTLEEGNSPAALNMVGMGLGVALICESAQDAALRGITFRPLTKPTPDVDLSACYRTGYRSATLRSFLETVRRVVPTVEAHGRSAIGESTLMRVG
jgi:DNA-binding transcriptional LysR family regulator